MESKKDTRTVSIPELSKIHHAAVVEAIVEFQFLEERLKFYIRESYKLVKLRLKDTIDFNYSEKEIDNASLGKLIFHFKKLSSDSHLADAMNSLTNDRNYVAHRGFVVQYETYSNAASYQEEIDKIKDITRRLRKCAMPLWEKSQQLTAVVGCEIVGDNLNEQKRKIHDIEMSIERAKSIISSNRNEDEMQKELDTTLRHIRKLATDCEFDPEKYGEAP